VQYATPSGKDYYHNATLNLTQWDKPRRDDDSISTTTSQSAGQLEAGTMTSTTQPELDGNAWFASVSENFDMAKTGAEHFNVTTEDVINRVITACLPYRLLKVEGKSVYREKPDVYGPFWICCTLIFALFACSNGYLWACGALDVTDFHVIIVGVIQVFGFWIGVPLALRMSLYWAGADPTLLPLREVLCVYGYSFIATIPMCLLCMLPFKLTQVLFCILALCWSIGLVAINFMKELKESLPHTRYLIVSFFTLSLVIFYLLFPAYYFKIPYGFVTAAEIASTAVSVENPVPAVSALPAQKLAQATAAALYPAATAMAVATFAAAKAGGAAVMPAVLPA